EPAATCVSCLDARFCGECFGPVGPEGMTQSTKPRLGRDRGVGIAGWQDPRTGPTRLAAKVCLLEDCDGAPPPPHFERDRQSDHAATDHNHVVHRVPETFRRSLLFVATSRTG